MCSFARDGGAHHVVANYAVSRVAPGAFRCAVGGLGRCGSPARPGRATRGDDRWRLPVVLCQGRLGAHRCQVAVCPDGALDDRGAAIGTRATTHPPPPGHGLGGLAQGALARCLSAPQVCGRRPQASMQVNPSFVFLAFFTRPIVYFALAPCCFFPSSAKSRPSRMETQKGHCAGARRLFQCTRRGTLLSLFLFACNFAFVQKKKVRLLSPPPPLLPALCGLAWQREKKRVNLAPNLNLLPDLRSPSVDGVKKRRKKNRGTSKKKRFVC